MPSLLIQSTTVKRQTLDNQTTPKSERSIVRLSDVQILVIRAVRTPRTSWNTSVGRFGRLKIVWFEIIQFSAFVRNPSDFARFSDISKSDHGQTVCWDFDIFRQKQGIFIY